MTIQLDGIDLATHDRFVDGIPFDDLARLRHEAPVYLHPERRGPGFWCVTRHDDVTALSRDYERFSVERGIMLFDQPELAPPEAPRMMIEMDPPRHTRYRLLVNKGFTPRMVNRLEEHMRAVARRTVDAVIEQGECDFVRDVASELPLQTIAELMSVPASDRARVFEMTNRIVGHSDAEMSGGGPAYDVIGALHAYGRDLAVARRATLAAGETADDILGTLLTAEVDGHTLSDADFEQFFLLLVVGGSETTRTAMAQGMLAFFEHPEEWGDCRTTARCSAPRSRRCCGGRRRSCTSGAPRPRTSSCGASRSGRARRSCSGTRRRTTTRTSSPIRTASTSGGIRTRT